MSDLIVIQPTVQQITVTEDVNQVVVSSVGVQGPAGTNGTNGATGATGAQGSSGVVTVNAPLTNAGTSSAADLSISAASTSASGIVQLSDSTSTTSSILASTPTATKAAYDAAVASVQTTRTISTTAPLTGGGDLSANRTLAVSAGSTSAAGVLQLTDSIASTSTTTAATPNAVKTAYDTGAAKFQFLPFRSGSYYVNANYVSSQTATANTTYYMPMYIPNAVTLDRLQIFTTSTFSGTASVRLGIYNDNGGVPNTVLVDGGTVSATAASTLYTVTISQAVTAGWYWMAFNTQTAATINSFYGTPASVNVPNALFPKVAAGGNALNSFGQTGVTGAFATAGTLVDGQTAYRFSVRVA